jgi:hypothetical protein
MTTRFLAGAAAILLGACGSSFQSVNVVAPGQTQVTGGMVRTTPDDDFDPESGAIYSGDLQVRHGVTDKVDLGVRYAGGNGLHYLAFDPKFQIIPKYVSVGAPIGVLFAEDGGFERMFDYGGIVISPTIYAGAELSPNTSELVFAPKIMWVLPDDGESDSEVGASLGFRLSTNLQKWAIMPELSYLDVTGAESGLLSFGIALSANYAP